MKEGGTLSLLMSVNNRSNRAPRPPFPVPRPFSSRYSKICMARHELSWNENKNTYRSYCRYIVGFGWSERKGISESFISKETTVLSALCTYVQTYIRAFTYMRRDISTCVYISACVQRALSAFNRSSICQSVESSRAATYLMTCARPTNGRTFAERKREKERKEWPISDNNHSSIR